ncbi:MULTISPECIES: aspartyl-phosphate phosphatase Spo0E family protein [Bacillaceae]|uniref:aspartyl-phosphate phosphatase Spo0E family protein n=1 Tax=Bacillaceae TaxID=186817 RepID=UPI001155094C|nr:MULTISPECIES: aspartyl-phosphate phosphatase Spo0E family protein [Bacillaceae]URM31069.1 aspartyl-phosphate phosphatase Spo0E family protein [Cytobacillus firmus]
MDFTEAIEQSRQAMIQSIYSKGLTDEETLKLSQELDKLIIESQRMKREANLQIDMKKLQINKVICK